MNQGKLLERERRRLEGRDVFMIGLLLFLTSIFGLDNDDVANYLVFPLKLGAPLVT